jgi:hypothetical protein
MGGRVRTVSEDPPRRYRVISESAEGDLFVFHTDHLERAEKMAELMREGHGNAQLITNDGD